MTVSKEFVVAVKLASERQYRLAGKAGISPSLLSCWINGIVTSKPYDERVIHIGRMVGLRAEQCFVTESESAVA